MADEFVKGLGILTGSGLLWMVLAGWYKTPGFAEAQLTGSPPGDLSTLGQLALVLERGAFWFAILGALTFWIFLPAARELRAALNE